ncbi:hypothetical protein SCUCBS95973_000260 [Sporothrix curviconia]|uniref:Uncharacterized protein n=1 Tax=Sporothrix curviconia TaxID=1260050 RepID=A0ABP0ANP2_9PEZI
MPFPGGLCVSPDGKRVAYYTRSRTRCITDGRCRDHSPRWSATGRYLYFLSNRKSGGKNCTLYYLDTYIAEDVDSIDTPETLEDRFTHPPEEHFKILLGQVANYRLSRRGPLEVTSTRCDNIAKFDVAYSGIQGNFAFLKGEPQDDSVGDDGVSWAHHTRISRYRPSYVYYANIGPLRVDGEFPLLPRSSCYVTDVAWSSDASQVVNVTRSRARRRDGVYFQMCSMPDDATSVKAIYRVDVTDKSLLLRAAQNMSRGPDPAFEAAAAVIVARPDYGRSESACEKVAGDEANCVRSFKVVRGAWSLNDENDDVLAHLQQGDEETLVLLRAGRTIYTTVKAIVDFAAANRKVCRGDAIVNETVLIVVKGSGDHANEVPAPSSHYAITPFQKAFNRNATSDPRDVVPSDATTAPSSMSRKMLSQCAPAPLKCMTLAMAAWTAKSLG